jgi:hypothetical protein
MAGNQMGIGMMLSQIGQSMANWGDQKREREQAAIQRALQERQLELAELKAERDERAAEDARNHQRFERAFSMNNSLPGGTPLSPEIVKDWEEIGMGPFVAPGKKEQFSVPNIHGIPGPLTGITGPARSIATAPPGLRQTDLTNARLRDQNAALNDYRNRSLGVREELGEKSATAALINALANQVRAQTGQGSASAGAGNMQFDNQMAARKQAILEADARVPVMPGLPRSPEDQALWDEIYNKKYQEFMSGSGVPSGNKSGIF